ncbi:MAG: T9SS type A sorting domain-containing protein [Ignavibacteria bacterium]|nr:T9SS type A sorting domain-containing protein [Ignavibacteria bacterium]
MKNFTKLKFLTLTFLMMLIFSSEKSYAQLSGNFTIPGDYANFTAAFNALNSLGVGPGGVTFRVDAGSVFNENPPELTATGTAGNPIIFEKFGVGANPLITPVAAGTITTTTLGNHADGIIIINGGDYITFDGISLNGNAALPDDATSKYEYGFYLKKASGDDAPKNIVIKNSVITLFHNTGATVGIGSGIFQSNISGTTTVTVTSTGGRSENNKFFSNQFTGCYIGIQFRGFNASTPFDFYDQNCDAGVDGGNTITNYGGAGSTAYGIYSIYQNNLRLANNTITSLLSTSTLYGIFSSTGTNSNVDIYGNTVTINGGGTTSTIYAINNATGSTGTSNTVNIYNNIVENCTYATATSGVYYGVYNTASALTVNMYGNIVRNNTKPGTTGAMYLLYSSSTAVDGFANVYNNQIYGNSNTAATGDLFCLYSNEVTTSTKNVYGNSVYNNTGNDDVHGINTLLGVQSNVYKNNVYNITSTTTLTTSPYCSGITVGSGTNVYVYNNFISDLKAPNSAATDAVRGISIITATTSANRGVYYNTIFLNATSTGVNFGSSGIFHIFSTTATTATLDMRNNNVVNLSTANGTGLTAAFRRSAATNLNNYGTNSNNNNFYAGIPSATNVIFTDGTNHLQSMNDFKTFVSPRETNSITGNPPFVNSTVPPYDLRINPASPTQLESAGQIISTPLAINVDYDDNARYPNMGYPFNPMYPPTAPDIGADEFGGIPADLTAPVIVYTALQNTASTGNRTLTAEITDPAGVMQGANGPRLYYKKSTDPSYIFDASPGIMGDNYTFTINTTLLGGVTSGTIIQYYVAAQDSAGNGGTQPAGGSGINPPGTTPPGSPSSYTVVPSLSGTYTIGATGDYPSLTAVSNILNNQNSEVVGNVVFELLADYDGTAVETVPIVFNEFVNAGDAGSPFTVTFRPAVGVTGRVTSGDPGSNFAFPVINLVGGKYFIFDGRPGGLGTNREWTIRNTRNTGTIGCVIRFADDGAFNTVQYCNIESQSNLTTTANIFFHTSTGTIGNSFNLISNNMIRGRTDVAADSIGNGILSNGSLAAPNQSNIVNANHIVNYRAIGVSLVATNTGNGPDWQITNNRFYSSVISGITQTGISSASTAATNLLIDGNIIGGSASDGSGMMTNSGNNLFTGISITGGQAVITDNLITNMTGTNTGTTARTRGIYVTAGADGQVASGNIVSNLISNSSVVSGYSAGSQAAVGISFWPGATFYNCEINNNTISNISTENTTAFTTVHSSCGMFLTNVKGNVNGNRIYDIKNKSTGITAGQPPVAAGILIRFVDSAFISNNMISLGNGENTNTQFAGIHTVTGTASNDNMIFYNSISILGTSGGSTGSYGIVRGDNSITAPLSPMVILNNAVVNQRTGGGSVNYALGFMGGDSSVFVFSFYNMLFNSDASTLVQSNANNYNFSQWKSNSGNETTSLSPTSLNLTNLFANVNIADFNVIGSNVESWLLNGNGAPLSNISSDYGGNPRSDSVATGATDIGAMEFTPSVNAPVNVFPVAGVGVYPLTIDGRTVGEINLINAGTADVPITQFDVRYIPGSNPPNANNPYHFGNAYWDISTNVGASGYLYDVTLNYNDAILGTIVSENNLRMAKSDDGITYVPYLIPGTGSGQYELNTTNNTIKVYGLSSFSFFGLTDDVSPLPVELSAFSATTDRNNVNLNWTTATEINNSGFDIERKLVGSESWMKIANIEGNGNSNEPKNYSYSDRNVTTGKYNYRLKQIDYNGNFEYFNLSSEVVVGIPDKYDISQNYPNPFNPSTKINYDLPFDSKVSIKVFDLLGREVFSILNNEQINAGYHTAQLNFGSMASGTYFYRIIAKGVNGKEFVMSKKMVLIR